MKTLVSQTNSTIKQAFAIFVYAIFTYHMTVMANELVFAGEAFDLLGIMTLVTYILYTERDDQQGITATWFFQLFVALAIGSSIAFWGINITGYGLDTLATLLF